MNKRMNKQICVSTNAQMNIQRDKRAFKRMFECSNKQIHKCLFVCLNKQTFQQTFNHSICRLPQSLFCLFGYLMVRYV